MPALYFSHRVSPRLAWGVGLHSPFGLKTKWANPDPSPAATSRSRAASAASPSTRRWPCALNDKLSLGAGLDLRFSSVRLVRRTGAVNPFTLTVNDTAEVVLDSDTRDGGRLQRRRRGEALGGPGRSGAHYRHKVKVDYSRQGARSPRSPPATPQLDAIVAGRLPQSPAVETAIEYPSILAAGVARDWTEWTVVADLVFFGWASFDELRLTFPTEPGLDSVIPENYHNIWQFRTGVERRLEEGWAVRFGYHYDKTPVPTESVSPLLPDNDRQCFSLGGSWKSASSHLRVDVGAWYLFLAERSTEGQNRDGYNGTYDNSAFTLGASFGYRF